jgi:hypothetical protein
MTETAFVCCPVSFDLSDAEWYDNVDDAKELLSIENASENLLAPVENNQTNV